jgi:2-polyprenyl-3-methyl-5-hydroxy-6-metoxy-1,4-benzoquinol methylase
VRMMLKAEARVAPSCHVNTEPQVRMRKARKVSRILDRLAPGVSGRLALDVGCGAGFLAEHLHQLGWDVIALDMADHRATSGFEFVVGRAESLPFASETFAVVLSNYVIEHVVDAAAHLREIRRVLAPGGLAYVAAPNRFALVEPHYKLPLLSWLPRGLADSYVRLLRRAEYYDVSPPSRGRLLRDAVRAGLKCEDVTAWMVAETAGVDGSPLVRLLNAVPHSVLHRLSPLSPSFVFVMRRM